MNKIIEQQLNKCKIAQVPEFDNLTRKLIIPKSSKEDNGGISVNSCYQIEIEDYIITPYEGFSLHDNWNHGVGPKDKLMNVEIKQVMGKMVYVNGVGSNSTNTWEGWLPRKSFTIKKVL